MENGNLLALEGEQKDPDSNPALQQDGCVTLCKLLLSFQKSVFEHLSKTGMTASLNLTLLLYNQRSDSVDGFQPFSPPNTPFIMSTSFPLLSWIPNYWSISFSINPSNECSGLISFRMDWLDLLAVQGTLKSLLQHCSSKASIFRPGLGRYPGEGKGYPLQYSGLENFMDCTVHGVTKSRT